ncbi:MAG: hypothetical protein ACPGJE_04130, partial [Wenzhouxiangellaceae bacterium]
MISGNKPARTRGRTLPSIFCTRGFCTRRGHSKLNRVRAEYHAARLVKYVNEYKKVFVVGVDNVGSKQMADIRHALRDGKGNKAAAAIVFIGK